MKYFNVAEWSRESEKNLKDKPSLIEQLTWTIQKLIHRMTAIQYKYGVFVCDSLPIDRTPASCFRSADV